MAANEEIRLQLGAAGKDFVGFWKEEAAKGRAPAGSTVELRPETKPKDREPGSPAEVVVSVPKGSPGGGARMALILWAELKEFFGRKPAAAAPAKGAPAPEAAIVFGGVRTMFLPSDMPARLPAGLEEAAKGVGK